MARKKKETMMESNGTAVAYAEPVTATALVEPLAQVPEATPIDQLAAAPTAMAQPVMNGQRRPVASWKFPVAAGVTVEVALWPHSITLQSGETIEVFNATVTRSYKDASGQWQKGGSYRVSEIPVLIHALLRAHGYALDAREQNCPI